MPITRSKISMNFYYTKNIYVSKRTKLNYCNNRNEKIEIDKITPIKKIIKMTQYKK